MKIVKGLPQAFMMLVALLAFSVHSMGSDAKTILKKKFHPSGDLDLTITSDTGNPEDPCRVGIINFGSMKEVFQLFANLYEAVGFIQGDGPVKLYDMYMSVARDTGPFSYELNPYYIMAVDSGGAIRFIKTNALNSGHAAEQIKPDLIKLFNYNPDNMVESNMKIDVKVLSENEAKAFAGFIMG